MGDFRDEVQSRSYYWCKPQRLPKCISAVSVLNVTDFDSVRAWRAQVMEYEEYSKCLSSFRVNLA